MKKASIYILLCISCIAAVVYVVLERQSDKIIEIEEATSIHWFILDRKSNIERLYYGIPCSVKESILVKTFTVKTGIPGQRPTPLPSLLGKAYWTITKKYDAPDNLETGPYFLELDIPYTEEAPYGPVPYLECNGQCSWELPGSFGLHGVGDDPSRLSESDPGSSGCIRHRNEDITYLYNLLDLRKEVRYYIQDV